MKAVNLLPSEQRASATSAPVSTPTPGGGAFGAYLLLGVLAFAVAASALYVLATNTIKDRKAELARVTSEAEATKAQASALQAYADFKTLADQRISTVGSLVSARFDWDRTLRDLSRALPSDVHLTALNGTTGTQTTAGSGALRGAIQAPALELSGCTRTQSSVATLMSRLRNVRGVTRVTLSKSDKDSGAGVSSIGAAADGGTPAQLCPKGAPPTFDLVVFFERAVLSAGATPNVAASGASGAQTGAPATNPAAPAGSNASGATGTSTTAPSTGATTTTPATGASATQGVSTK